MVTRKHRERKGTEGMFDDCLMANGTSAEAEYLSSLLLNRSPQRYVWINLCCRKSGSQNYKILSNCGLHCEQSRKHPLEITGSNQLYILHNYE